ncbi:restriction endonuclease [Xanthomonas hortorum]|uniref:Restriction endonuclease type IV Mrr domain-containing protein n=1 Tax=Xanthomonas hortorum pv. pelargonii TaxID=453602 RepID=A0AAW9ZV59_9XANT|nr:hypothetical protein [Xanthomonas hortorum pv. pelargonii]
MATVPTAGAQGIQPPRLYRKETDLGREDGGIDLILRKDIGRILVQCKQWNVSKWRSASRTRCTACSRAVARMG